VDVTGTGRTVRYVAVAGRSALASKQGLAAELRATGL
jgi:hypothetical protein